MDTLKLTDNSKTKFKRNHFNTFGLNYGLPEDGGTCPGATSGCGGCLSLKKKNGKVATCYMAKLVKAYPNLAKVLEANTQLLRGKSIAEMETILASTMDQFLAKCKGEDLYFRISTSGDFFSEDYAKAWARVINRYNQIQFWGYTRNFSVIPCLAECKNLALYLSADPVNYKEALSVFVKYRGAGYTNIGISFMGDTKSIEQLKDARWVVCPEITGKVKNTCERGACAKCKLCFTYTDKKMLRNIEFPIH